MRTGVSLGVALSFVLALGGCGADRAVPEDVAKARQACKEFTAYDFTWMDTQARLPTKSLDEINAESDKIQHWKQLLFDGAQADAKWNPLKDSVYEAITVAGTQDFREAQVAATDACRRYLK